MTAVAFPENLPGHETEHYVLHRPPMLLVDRLVTYTEETAECEFRISPDNAFHVRGKGVPSYVGIEYMAQCIAVHAGARARLSGLPPPIGFLLGCRNLQMFRDFLVERQLHVASCQQMLRSADGMGSFDCQIVSDGQLITSARLAVLERHDEEAFSLRLS